MGRKEKIIVGLDIGSSKVTTLIAVPRADGLDPIGIGIAESKGLKKGVVVNIEAAVESIRKSVAEAEAALILAASANALNAKMRLIKTSPSQS